MNRQYALVAIVTTTVIGSLFAGTSQAQKQPYDRLMREIQATFDSLRKNLDANAAAAAVTDAAKLEGLFKDTEAFWTPFRTKDALDAAKGAAGVSAAIAAAARENDVQKAKTAFAGVGRFCAGCHGSHREQMSDKSFRIKP